MVRAMSSPAPSPDRRLEGKIAIVTGATAGIGLVTARRLAQAGAEVALVSRSPARLEAALSEIGKAAPGARLHAFSADLSLMAETRRVAGELVAALPRLDVLVNNAGAVFSTRQETPEGLERTFALNHMSYFLLTNLLLDRLKAAPQGRVVSVASAAHRQGTVDLADLQTSRRAYQNMMVYGATKLMNILFTRELARRLAGTTATANCLHPGFVASSFGDNNGPLFAGLLRVAKLFAISEERGADTSVFLATSPEVAGVTGEYFAKCRVARTRAVASDAALAAGLWEASAKLSGI